MSLQIWQILSVRFDHLFLDKIVCQLDYGGLNFLPELHAVTSLLGHILRYGRGVIPRSLRHPSGQPPFYKLLCNVALMAGQHIQTISSHGDFML